MSRESDLERQLAEYRAAKKAILEKLDDAMRLPDNRKAEMWNTVVPILKSALESRIERGGDWNAREVQLVVWQKVMLSLFDVDYEKKLDVLL